MTSSESSQCEALLVENRELRRRIEELEARADRELGNDLTELVEASPDILYIYDVLSKKNVYCNSSLNDILGYSVTELQEMGDRLLLILMHPDDFEEYLTRTVGRYQSAQGNQLILHKYRMKHKAGHWCWLEARERVLKRNPDGSPWQILGSISDISERVRAEQHAAELSVRMNSLLSSINDAFFALDENMVVTYFNPAAERALGRITADVLGIKLFDAFPEARGSIFEEKYSSALKNKISLSFETYFGVAPYENWYSVRVYPFEKGISVFFQLISERKQAEEKIKASEEKLRAVLDVAGVMMVVIDTAQRVVLVNRKACLVLEREEMDVVGRNWFDLAVPAGESEGLKHGFSELMADRVEPWEYVENNVVTSSGRERLIAWHNALLRDGSGKIVASISSGEDITERRRMEEKLAASEERYRSLVEGQTDLVSRFYADGTFLYVSPSYCRFFGKTSEQLVGQAWQMRAHSADLSEVEIKLLQLSPENPVVAIENRVSDATNQPHWIQFVNRGFFDENGKLLEIQSVGRDITEKKQALEDLVQAKLAAEAANLAKSRFLANVSHEIRTPLNAIIGFCQIMKASEVSRQERDAFLDTIIGSGWHLTSLIDDVLDLAKIEVGNVKVESAPVSIGEVLRKTSDLLLPRAREKRIDLSFREGDSLPGAILSDSTRIRQVLIILVDNALKFTASGGRVTVTAGYGRGGGRLEFSVADSGIGIAASERESIFEMFYQVNSSATRNSGGTGLGLTLARKLCRLLGGDVVLLKSEIGVGSVFVATFAVDAVEGRCTDKGVEKSSRDVKGFLSGMRILLAEDDLASQRLIQILIEKCSGSVVVVANGADALARARSESFDLILMDMSMPVVDGLTATRTLRQEGYLGPIIALTAHVMPDAVEASRAAGCNRHITKPINLEKFLEILEGIKQITQSK